MMTPEGRTRRKPNKCLLDLGEKTIAALDFIAQAQEKTRVAVVREAVSNHIDKFVSGNQGSLMVEVQEDGTTKLIKQKLQ